MGQTVSSSSKYVNEQAQELSYLEKKIKKFLSVCSPVNHIASCLFAFQLCLLNFNILLYTCDEPIRSAVLQIPMALRINDWFSGIYQFSTAQMVNDVDIILCLGKIILFTVMFFYGIPVLISILAKWIIFAFSRPRVFTNTTAPTASTLAADSKRIYEQTNRFPDEALRPRFIWAAIFYVISAVPFVHVLLQSGFDGSYISSEIFALVIWILLVLLGVYLLALPIRPVVRGLTSNTDLRYNAKRMAEELKLPETSAKPAQTAKKSQPKPATPAAKPATSSSSGNYSSTGSIDKYDSFSWTYGYVRDNEDTCSSISLSCLNVAKELLGEGDIQGAARGFEHVIRGLELLQNFDEGHYQPPLYANAYALAKIAAFGLRDMSMAKKYAQLSCKYASQCANAGRSNSAMAGRDLSIIRRFSNALERGDSIYELIEDFGDEYPNDIVYGN